MGVGARHDGDLRRFDDPQTGDPDRFSTVSRLKAYFLAPKVRALYDATVVAGLREAGLPED